MMALYCCELSILGALYDGDVKELPKIVPKQDEHGTIQYVDG
jgi:hypothetical protein